MLGTIGAAGAGLVAGCSGDGGSGDGGSGDGGSGDGGSGDGGSGDGGSGDGGSGDGGSGDGGSGDGGSGDGGSGDGGMDVSTMVIAEPDRPSTLDPHTLDPTDTNGLYAYPENGYETLIYYAPGEDTELVPALAAEVPSSDNGLITNNGQTLEFPLREGVTFHTGGEMTAEDVRYSWDRSMTMGIGPGSGPLSNSVDSMEVVDDYTFRVTLNRSTTPIFLNSVITNPAAAIVSKAAVEENGGFAEGQPNDWVAQNSCGTGPFVLGEGTPNSIAWNQHEDYWGETGTQAVEQRVIGDTASRIAQLQRGDLDYAYVSLGDISEVEGIDGVTLRSGIQINPGGIIFNYDIPYDRDDVRQIAGDDTVPPDFFQSRDIRKAFAHIIPWDTLIENIMGGYGQRTKNMHVPGTFGYDPDAPQFEQDLDLVEEHLRAAGYWEDGFRVTLHNENITEFERLNLLIKDEMESLNSNITINSVSEPEGRAVERHAQDPPGWPAEVHALLPIGTDPTPYYVFWAHPDGDMASRTGAPDHINPRIPELIGMTETETSIEARNEQFAELQRLTFEDPPVATGYAPLEVYPHRDCIESVWSSAWSRPHFKHWDFSNC